MNSTTRTLIAIPLAAAALSAGATAAMAQPAGPIISDLDIAQPEPQPEPHPQPGPQLPGDKVGPAGDPDPDVPDDKAGPNHGDDDDGDDDDGDNDDSDNDDGDNDDGDNDDGDNDDSDNDDGDVKRPTRVDAGGSDGLSLAWLLGSGAMVTAAGGFTARRVALKRR